MVRVYGKRHVQKNKPTVLPLHMPEDLMELLQHQLLQIDDITASYHICHISATSFLNKMFPDHSSRGLQIIKTYYW